MVKNPARLFFSLLLLTTYYLLLTTSPVSAQSSEPVPQSTHNYVQTVMIDTMAALTCQLTGIDPVPQPGGELRKCLGYDQQTGELGFVDPSTGSGGAIGAMGSFIAVLYNPPISSGDYFSYLARNFGIAKPAYAASDCDPNKPGIGTGFCGLKPLLSLWTFFRKLVYILFAAAFVLIGLAIMLRIHIDPRTVMTIQNQIPKLIIALILVTFSYAIAGLLVDLMYVVIFLLFGVFNSIPGTKLPTNFSPQDLQGSNPIEAYDKVTNGFGELIKNASFGVGKLVWDLLTGANLTPEDDVSIPLFSGVWNVVTGGVRNLVGGFLGVIAGILALLIIAIAILWSLFRLWFQLLMAFVLFLLDVVFAPFWILASVLPGVPIGFGAWLRSALSNLSPFPVTVGMFLLAKIFMDSFNTVTAFVPPLIGNPGENFQALGSFIGLAFILLTPQVVAMMKDYLKAPVFKYQAAIGQAVGAGAGAPGRVAGGTLSTAFSPHYQQTPQGPQLIYPGGTLGRVLRGFGLIR